MFILIVIAAGLRSYYLYLLSPVNSSNLAKTTFLIQPGESTLQIARRLEAKKLIRSANAFTILARRESNLGHIQAGEFTLSPSMSGEEIFSNLRLGMADKRVTLVEGWRIEEMADKLNKELKITNEDFIKVAKEGYMFPDTYSFTSKMTASEAAQIMKENFKGKYDTSIQAKIQKLGLTSEQGVILASIVEREARSDEPRRMVASILLKRFKIGMALNADATVQYILGFQPAEKSWWKRHLTHNDLKVDSPYNTYLHAGLPPTPISNPGLSSLQAVASADPSTPYLYYYHDSQGQSHYARTLEEHNDNIAAYR